MAETRCKYYKQKRQVSYDGGQTWQDVIPYQYQRGELYEYESADCGAVVVYRWVNMDASVDYYCEGTTKYYKQKKQVSYDGGQTWIDVSPAEYQRGGVAEQRSTDCGYVPPTPQYRWIKSDDTICVESPEPPTGKKFVATYYNGTTREVECNSSTELTSGETRPSGFDYRKMSNAVIGQCVTTIGEEAFEYCDGLTSVTIPNSVITIGVSAFYMSSRLTSIDIPDSVTSIGLGAFANCSGLTSLNIGNSVTTIGDLAFDNCTGLTSVSIPNSVTSIGDNAFDWCTSLTSVTIPNSVTTIGGWAFNYCSGLTSVNIPDSVTSIGMSAFNYCSGLTSITVEATTPPTLEPYVFDNTNNCPIYVPCQSVDTYKSAENWSTYASRIQGIPPCGETSKKLVANYDDSKTLEVDCNGDGTLTSGETQPSGYEKNRMTDAVIGNCVTTIGDNAFYGCDITSITMSNSITTIGEKAFFNCTGLTSVNIPDSVTYIGNGAFWTCSGLTSITIPNSVTEIDIYAFYRCRSLTSVTIGNSVTTIGGSAFHSCSGLTSIVIPDSVTNLGGGVFYDCRRLTSVTIGNSVTNLDNDVFWCCSSLTGITIPDSVTTIGEKAFYYCTRLTSVIIGNSVTTIGNEAFAHCDSLTGVTIPNSVATIGDSAFVWCQSLTSVTVEAITPPTLVAGAFYGTNSCPIYVPAASVSAYKSASGWSEYASRIQAIP